VKAIVLSKRVKVFLRISCAALLLFIIFSKVRKFDLADFKTKAYLLAFVAASMLNVAQSFLCTFRWGLIQRVFGKPPPFSTSIWAYLECGFCNQALPSFIGGDAVRVLRWCESGVTAAHASASVVFDRAFGALGAAILALVACALLRDTDIERYKLASVALLAGGVFGACAAFLLVVRLRTTHKWFSRARRLHTFLIAVADWRPSGVGIAFFVLLGVVGQVVAGFSVYVLAHALGINLSAPVLVSVTGILLLVAMIPISFAGWGVREAAFITLLVPLGTSSSASLALGVSLGLATLVGSVPGGISVLFNFAGPPKSNVLHDSHAAKERALGRSGPSRY